jgi:hypothetical protein
MESVMERSRVRPAKEYDIKFYVVWNQDRRAFDVKRDGVPTGHFAKDKSTAIDLAIAKAQLLTSQGSSACVYAYSQHGNRVVQWESFG